MRFLAAVCAAARRAAPDAALVVTAAARLVAIGGIAFAMCAAFAACTALQDPTTAEVPTAKAPEKAPEDPDHCFGDSPPEVIARDARPVDILATGNDVFWQAATRAPGGSAADAVLHRWDVATGRVSTLTVPRSTFFVAADAHGIFGLEAHMMSPTTLPDSTCIDLPSGAARVLVRSADWGALLTPDSRPLGSGPNLFRAGYALDSDYIYVAWAERNRGPSLGASGPGHLARVKRDGSSRPEPLGEGPGGAFILSDGYAYWGGQRTEGLERRALTPGAAEELLWAPPGFGWPWALGVSGGRLDFKRGDPIESVPVVRATVGGDSPPPLVHTGTVGMVRPPPARRCSTGDACTQSTFRSKRASRAWTCAAERSIGSSRNRPPMRARTSTRGISRWIPMRCTWRTTSGIAS